MDLTISIVSHGHGQMVADLLDDLNADVELKQVSVVLTLNVADMAFDRLDLPNLRLTIIRNPSPKGFGANHNAAFGRCRTAWFLILNPDVRIRAPFAGALIAQADGGAGPPVDLIAAQIVDRAGAQQDAVRTLVTPWSIMTRLVRGRRSVAAPERWSSDSRPFLWIAGMFLLVRSRAFADIGGFDERYFLYYEDYDLSARMYLSGYALAQSREVSVVHEAQRASHRSARHLRWHIASLLRVWSTAPFWRLLLAGGRSGRGTG